MQQEINLEKKYKEWLPQGCPGDLGGPLPSQVLLRLVGPGPVTAEDFLSHAALGYPCHDRKKWCEWHSCSMFMESIPGEYLRSLRKYPRLRTKSAIAKVQVDESVGDAFVKPTKHVDVWFFEHFDPVGAVAAVVNLDDFR